MSDITVLLVPLVTGVLVLLTHVPLGEQVLRRGIVFIDLAVAQVAALGVMMAAPVSDRPWVVWLAGSAAALLGAALVAWLSRLWPARREALIGLVYITAAAAALLWVSADPRGAQRLSAMLSGDVLWVNWHGLVPLTLGTAAFLVVQRLRPGLWANDVAFYACFALLVSLSVPLLGLYLVFASLIVPALTMMAPNRLGRAAAIALGTGAYLAGLLASLWWDLPSGPCVVVALMVAGTAAVLSRRAGVGVRLGVNRP